MLRSLGLGMATKGKQSDRLDGVITELVALSSYLVTKLGETGETLPWNPPTLAELTWQLQLGHCMTLAHLLETDLMLLRDFRKGVDDLLNSR